MVTEDEQMKVRMRELLRSTADKVLGADMDKLSERMADAFVDSLRKD
jgi:hypothetical protein